jgi:rod shape-determining protein MreD
MPRGSDQLLLPVNPFFIAFTLLVALLLEMLPGGRHPAAPDLLALVLVFWSVHQPRRVGVGFAFAFGLVMDVHQGAVLGQHALAYTLLSYLAISVHRRVLWFSLPAQALHVLPVFFAAHAVAMVARLAAGGMFPGWAVLLAPQRRAPDPDKNRPL